MSIFKIGDAVRLLPSGEALLVDAHGEEEIRLRGLRAGCTGIVIDVDRRSELFGGDPEVYIVSFGLLPSDPPDLGWVLGREDIELVSE